MYRSFIDKKSVDSNKTEGISKNDQQPTPKIDVDSPKEASLEIPPPPMDDSPSDIEELNVKKTSSHSRSNFQWSHRIRHLVAYAAVKSGADGFQKNSEVYAIFLGLLKKNGRKDSPPFSTFKKQYNVVKNLAEQMYKLKQQIINMKGKTDTEKKRLKPEYDKLDERLNVLRRDLYGRVVYEIDSSVEANYNCLGELLDSDLEESAIRERMQSKKKKKSTRDEARGMAYARGDPYISGPDSDADLSDHNHEHHMVGESPSRTPRNRRRLAAGDDNSNSDDGIDEAERQIEEEENSEVGTHTKKKRVGSNRQQKRTRQNVLFDELEATESAVPSADEFERRFVEQRLKSLDKTSSDVVENLSNAVAQKLDEPLRNIAETMNALLEFMKANQASIN